MYGANGNNSSRTSCGVRPTTRLISSYHIQLTILYTVHKSSRCSLNIKNTAFSTHNGANSQQKLSFVIYSSLTLPFLMFISIVLQLSILNEWFVFSLKYYCTYSSLFNSFLYLKNTKYRLINYLFTHCWSESLLTIKY